MVSCHTCQDEELYVALVLYRLSIDLIHSTAMCVCLACCHTESSADPVQVSLHETWGWWVGARMPVQCRTPLRAASLKPLSDKSRATLVHRLTKTCSMASLVTLQEVERLSELVIRILGGNPGKVTSPPPSLRPRQPLTLQGARIADGRKHSSHYKVSTMGSRATYVPPAG